MDKMKRDPNEAWKGEGDMVAQMVMNGEKKHIPCNIDTLANAKRYLRKEWPKRRANFIKAWHAMTFESREDLIRSISPFTPRSPLSPSLSVNGVETNVKGACVLFPHLCISELVPGDKLIRLMDSRTDASRTDLEMTYLDYDFIKALINEGSIKGNVDKMEKKLNYLQPSEKFGLQIDNKNSPSPSHLYEWFKKEIIINASAFSSVFNFQQTTYSMLSRILEEVDTEIFDKESVLTVMDSGCAKCKSLTWSEDASKGLKLCICAKVAYCSRECQKDHWEEHKVDHVE